MATQRREISLTTSADLVWSAIRDFSQVHTRVAPGFLTALEMRDGDRLVTFFNGMVARERLVTRDDERRRLVYAVVEGRASHYSAALEVFPAGPDASRLDDRPAAGRARAGRRRDDGSGDRRRAEDAVRLIRESLRPRPAAAGGRRTS